jgi:hypothetical protein
MHGMHRLALGAYLVVAVVICPLVGYRLAVAGTRHGFGWGGFLLVLFGVPVIVAAITAVALRRSRRSATLGAAAAVAATMTLLVVVVFVALSTRY